MDKDTSFQTYDDATEASTCAPRLAALRAELVRRGLDGFIVPRADEHQGEYVPKRAERLAWLTAFTGSAGAAGFLQGEGGAGLGGRPPPSGARKHANTKILPPPLVGARAAPRGLPRPRHNARRPPI